MGCNSLFRFIGKCVFTPCIMPQCDIYSRWAFTFLQTQNFHRMAFSQMQQKKKRKNLPLEFLCCKSLTLCKCGQRGRKRGDEKVRFFDHKYPSPRSLSLVKCDSATPQMNISFGLLCVTYIPLARHRRGRVSIIYPSPLYSTAVHSNQQNSVGSWHERKKNICTKCKR